MALPRTLKDTDSNTVFTNPTYFEIENGYVVRSPVREFPKKEFRHTN